MNIKKPKIAVFHDAFLYRGGGERLVTLMAKWLDADLISGFFSEWSFIPEELGFSGTKIALGKPVFAKWIRHTILKNRFKKATKMLYEYDIVILSGNCLDILHNFQKTEKSPKIFYYCHTPPRYLFDLRGMYLAKIPGFLQGMVNRFFDSQAKKYISLLEKVDTIFTNSKNTHDRLLDFCKKESDIVYPPTDLTRFEFLSDEQITQKKSYILDLIQKNSHKNFGEDTNYYLSFARLAPAKRVNLVVDAFLAMPDKNLVFTYGKNDPMKDEILEKVKNAKNIFPIPAPSDSDFIGVIQCALANIYIPIDEDFGMSPVESMACGVPVIGVNEWGLKETIIEGKTGILLPKNIATNDIIDGVQKMDEATLKNMRNDSLIRAKEFSLESFIARLKSFL